MTKPANTKKQDNMTILGGVLGYELIKTVNQLIFIGTRECQHEYFQRSNPNN